MDPLPISEPVRLAEIAGRRPRTFRLAPDPAMRAELAAQLGVSAIGTLRFEGSLAPSGRHDVLLEARLKASVTQPCIVTLAPVTTRIEEAVTRRYLADMPEPEGDEVEMPEDETAEPLPATLDLAEVMTEALALALPLYPRADGAELDPPPPEAEETETTRPFAGLKDLMAQGKKDPGDEGGKSGG